MYVYSVIFFFWPWAYWSCVDHGSLKPRSSSKQFESAATFLPPVVRSNRASRLCSTHVQPHPRAQRRTVDSVVCSRSWKRGWERGNAGWPRWLSWGLAIWAELLKSGWERCRERCWQDSSVRFLLHFRLYTLFCFGRTFLLSTLFASAERSPFSQIGLFIWLFDFTSNVVMNFELFKLF